MQLVVASCAELLRSGGPSDDEVLLFLTKFISPPQKLQAVLPLAWRSQPVQEISKAVSQSVTSYVDSLCAQIVKLCSRLQEENRTLSSSAADDAEIDVPGGFGEIDLFFGDILSSGHLLLCVIGA